MPGVWPCSSTPAAHLVVDVVGWLPGTATAAPGATCTGTFVDPRQTRPAGGRTTWTIGSARLEAARPARATFAVRTIGWPGSRDHPVRAPFPIRGSLRRDRRRRRFQVCGLRTGRAPSRARTHSSASTRSAFDSEAAWSISWASGFDAGILRDRRRWWSVVLDPHGASVARGQSTRALVAADGTATGFATRTSRSVRNDGARSNGGRDGGRRSFEAARESVRRIARDQPRTGPAGAALVHRGVQAHAAPIWGDLSRAVRRSSAHAADRAISLRISTCEWNDGSFDARGRPERSVSWRGEDRRVSGGRRLDGRADPLRTGSRRVRLWLVFDDGR